MRPSNPFRPLDTEETLEEARAASEEGPVVLFKHSISCPISAGAHSEMETLTADDDPPVYRLIVQQARPLSQRIAQDLGIRHESPQVIVLRNGRPVFHASHGRVRADTIREASKA